MEFITKTKQGYDCKVVIENVLDGRRPDLIAKGGTPEPENVLKIMIYKNGEWLNVMCAILECVEVE